MSNAAMKYSLTSTYVDNFFSFFFLRRVPGVKWLNHVIRVCLPTDTLFSKAAGQIFSSFFYGWTGSSLLCMGSL